MNKDILIRNLGMTEKEAMVYMAILELGLSAIQPIAARSGVKRTSIYYFIDHLVEMGLVEQVHFNKKIQYKALSPKRMVDLQKNRLAEIEKVLPDFNSIFNVSTDKPHISYYEGPEQIKNIMMEETRCKKEARYIWPGSVVTDMVGGLKFMEELDRLRKANGTFIYAIRFEDKEIVWPGSAHGKDNMRDLRFAPEGMDFPMAIGIYDTGKVGFITSKKEGLGIMIESKELEEAMKILFGFYWQKCKPVKVGEG